MENGIWHSMHIVFLEEYLYETSNPILSRGNKKQFLNLHTGS